MSVPAFSLAYSPIPRRGFTHIEAVEFARREFPQEQSWTNWYVLGKSYGREFDKIVGKGYHQSGKIGDWSWSRVLSSYPALAFWEGNRGKSNESCDWVGFLRIQGPNGEGFLLFSFLNSAGLIGQWYLASTHDMDVLDRFAQAVYQHFNPSGKLKIHVQGGRDIDLNLADDERIFLPDEMHRDIEGQVFSFFENAAMYKKMRLRHRRGFLFVGSPGTGKTMLLRQLIRQCHLRFKASSFMLSMRCTTGTDDLEVTFLLAAQRAPAIVILEDVDSLTTESMVSRASMLAQLDGLDRKEGLLVIGTTNNPEKIDPALVHRPSRFDRVWRFALPDYELRYNYLQWALDGLERETLATVAKQTAEWSFAYLNELRTTAAIMSIGRGEPAITVDDLFDALDLLSAQFHAGKKNHVVSETNSSLGFKAA